MKTKKRTKTNTKMINNLNMRNMKMRRSIKLKIKMGHIQILE